MYWLYLLVYVAVGIVSPAVYMWIIRSFFKIQKQRSDPDRGSFPDIKSPNRAVVLVLMVEAGLFWPGALPTALIILLAYWIWSLAYDKSAR